MSFRTANRSTINGDALLKGRPLTLYHVPESKDRNITCAKPGTFSTDPLGPKLRSPIPYLGRSILRSHSRPPGLTSCGYRNDNLHGPKTNGARPPRLPAFPTVDPNACHVMASLTKAACRQSRAQSPNVLTGSAGQGEQFDVSPIEIDLPRRSVGTDCGLKIPNATPGTAEHRLKPASVLAGRYRELRGTGFGITWFPATQLKR